MKRLILLAFAVSALTAISCGKDVDQDNKEDVIKGKSPQIIGIIDNGDVKTTYDSEGKFSWVANDKILVQIVNGDSYSSHVFKAASSAAQTTFTVDGGAIADGYSVGEYAFYPNNVATAESPFDLVYNNNNPVSITLPAETGDYLINSNLLKMVPLIGKKTAVDGTNYTFNFCTATGILKLNFEGVPNESSLRVDLKHSTYPLCGEFTISEENTILASNYVSGNTTRTLKPSPGFSTVYVALPISDGSFSDGIPAGLEIVLRRSTTVYSRITTNTPIKIERNKITELTQPIKPIHSTVALCSTSTSDNPKATVTVGEGEAIALSSHPSLSSAIANLKDSNKSSWRGGVDGGWITESGDYSIRTTNSTKCYLVWKIKAADGHVYYKSTSETALSFYEISTTMRDDWIVGTFNVTDPVIYSNNTGSPITSSSFTFAASSDISKGNVMLTEFNGKTAKNKIFGIYDGYTKASAPENRRITFPRSNIGSTVFYNDAGTDYYFSNGATAQDVVFYLDDLSEGKRPCYLESGWCGFRTSGNAWKVVFKGSTFNKDATKYYFYGLRD